MSEPALGTSSVQRPALAMPRSRRSRLSALEALERGFVLFRSTFASEAWRYYLGTAPLLIGFIAAWVINGQIRISHGVLLGQAMLLAAAYLLRVRMVGTYMRSVRERAFSTPVSRGAGTITRAAAVGRMLAWKVALAAGALSVLPSVAGASWLYSACQFASLEGEADGERHSFTDCLGLANQWFGGSVLLFLLLVPLWIAVWLNILMVAIILPQLLHSIFGVKTLLSTQMGIYALIRSSAFWLSSLAGGWLALDPVVKCTFVVVYQHLRSRREGDDLRGLLSNLPRVQQQKEQLISAQSNGGRLLRGTVMALAVVLLGSAATTARAATTPGAAGADGISNSAVRIQKLRQAVDQESQRAIYRWHDAEGPSTPTWFDKLVAKIEHGIERAWNAVSNFLRRLWPSGWNLSFGNEKRGARRLKDLLPWLTLIGILTLAAAGVLFWLRLRRKTPPMQSLPVEIVPFTDMADEAAAGERSEDEWFTLASRLEGEGELRLALRAAYFGLLSGLAQREWLTIRRDVTNREYLNEFTRRWSRRPQAALELRTEIPERLRGSLRQFDRVWYGLHAVTPDAVTLYRRDQQEFLSHV